MLPGQIKIEFDPTDPPEYACGCGDDRHGGWAIAIGPDGIPTARLGWVENIPGDEWIAMRDTGKGNLIENTICPNKIAAAYHLLSIYMHPDSIDHEEEARQVRKHELEEAF